MIARGSEPERKPSPRVSTELIGSSFCKGAWPNNGDGSRCQKYPVVICLFVWPDSENRPRCQIDSLPQNELINVYSRGRGTKTLCVLVDEV